MASPILMARLAEVDDAVKQLANRTTNPPPQDVEEVSNALHALAEDIHARNQKPYNPAS